MMYTNHTLRSPWLRLAASALILMALGVVVAAAVSSVSDQVLRIAYLSPSK